MKKGTVGNKSSVLERRKIYTRNMPVTFSLFACYALIFKVWLFVARLQNEEYIVMFSFFLALRVFALKPILQ